MRDFFYVVTKNQKHSYNTNEGGMVQVASPPSFSNNYMESQIVTEEPSLSAVELKEARAIAELELGMLEKGFQALQLRSDNNTLSEDPILKQAFESYKKRLIEIRSVLVPKTLTR